MFDVVRKAGLTPDEFRDVLDCVSRVAVYNWMASPPRSKPHKMVRDRVDKALVMLKKLVDRGTLPLRDDLSRETRKEKIAKLRKVYQEYANK